VLPDSPVFNQWSLKTTERFGFGQILVRSFLSHYKLVALMFHPLLNLMQTSIIHKITIRNKSSKFNKERELVEA